MKAFYVWYAIGSVVFGTMFNYWVFEKDRSYKSSSAVYRGSSSWHK